MFERSVWAVNQSNINSQSKIYSITHQRNAINILHTCKIHSISRIWRIIQQRQKDQEPPRNRPHNPAPLPVSTPGGETSATRRMALDKRLGLNLSRKIACDNAWRFIIPTDTSINRKPKFFFRFRFTRPTGAMMTQLVAIPSFEMTESLSADSGKSALKILPGGDGKEIRKQRRLQENNKLTCATRMERNVS